MENTQSMSCCGAYAEHWETLGKPKGWGGCSLPPGHEGAHTGDITATKAAAMSSDNVLYTDLVSGVTFPISREPSAGAIAYADLVVALRSLWEAGEVARSTLIRSPARLEQDVQDVWAALDVLRSALALARDALTRAFWKPYLE